MSNYASAVDTETYGEYTITRAPDDTRPVYRFDGRISADGSTGYPAESGRYHVYSGWFCPWAQRVTLVIELAGLAEAVGVSYVDSSRDGRGWAFREGNGPDPVNGFTLLRDAYDATEPGFDGHVSVPTLWDRETKQVVSNTFDTLDADLASQFEAYSDRTFDLYPQNLRVQIDGLESWLRATVNSNAHVATGRGPAAEEAAVTVYRTYSELDSRLAVNRYLLGDDLTLADIRLWVTLVRHDAAAAGAGTRRLADFPNLWRYARDLYSLRAFRATTDFASFGASANVADDWQSPIPSSATVR